MLVITRKPGESVVCARDDSPLTVVRIVAIEAVGVRVELLADENLRCKVDQSPVELPANVAMDHSTQIIVEEETPLLERGHVWQHGLSSTGDRKRLFLMHVAGLKDGCVRLAFSAPADLRISRFEQFV